MVKRKSIKEKNFNNEIYYKYFCHLNTSFLNELIAHKFIQSFSVVVKKTRKEFSFKSLKTT